MNVAGRANRGECQDSQQTGVPHRKSSAKKAGQPKLRAALYQLATRIDLRLPARFGQAADDAVGDGGGIDFQGDFDVGPLRANWAGGRRSSRRW